VPRTHSRQLLIRDGNTVHFICFVEQLSIIGKEVTVYVIGDLTPELKRFDRKWMKLRV
jgi:hypothetical protein